MSQEQQSQLQPQPQPQPTLQDIFDDIGIKFFYNLPDSELNNFERLLYQLQQAYWYYHDNYIVNNKYNYLPKYKEKNFITQFFKQSPWLHNQLHTFNNIYDKFKKYINSIPVCGAILINDQHTHVCMVQSYHSHAWSFPRGKLDQQENDIECAIRECKEEIGFDITQYINNKLYIQEHSNGKNIKLFICDNIDSNTAVFNTETKYEISDIQWIKINDLPSKNNTNGSNKYKFGNVLIFAIRLREYIRKTYGDKNNNIKQQQRSQTHSLSPIPHHNNNNYNQQKHYVPSDIKPTLVSANRHHKKQSAHNNTHRSHSQSSNRKSTYDNNNERDYITFGDFNNNGWSADEMFKVNELKYGIKSNTNDNLYNNVSSNNKVHSNSMDGLDNHKNNINNNTNQPKQQSVEAMLSSVLGKPISRKPQTTSNTPNKPNNIPTPLTAHNKQQQQQQQYSSTCIKPQSTASRVLFNTIQQQPQQPQQPHTSQSANPIRSYSTGIMPQRSLSQNNVDTNTTTTPTNNKQQSAININDFSFDQDSILSQITLLKVL